MTDENKLRDEAKNAACVGKEPTGQHTHAEALAKQPRNNLLTTLTEAPSSTHHGDERDFKFSDKQTSFFR